MTNLFWVDNVYLYTLFCELTATMYLCFVFGDVSLDKLIKGYFWLYSLKVFQFIISVYFSTVQSLEV